jgi:alanine-synthesizing transaminase
LKLAWTMVSGPPALVDEALTRLEIIADTYLSVSTPIQLAAPALLDDTHSLRAQIQARLETNLTCLEAMTAGSPVTLLRPEGGWSAVLRLPAIEPEEALVLRLIDEDHVLVHPGYFFDFDTEAWLVVSLLPEPERFRDAIRRVVARAGTLAVS